MNQGYDVPGVAPGGIGMTDAYQAPTYLAQMATQMHQQDPGMMGQLLGGMGGSSVGKGALGGVAAMVVKQFMG